MGTGTKRAAVVIGVDRTGDLPLLQAASSGAETFADWARGRQYDVELITDKGGAAVTLAQIKAAVKAFVDAQTYEQLVVYFAGHGILKGPGQELWLLSGSPADPNEAVDVYGSIWFGRDSRIPHLVLISDACRSATTGTRLVGVMGGAIFPNAGMGGEPPDVDRFYATRPGNPAYEVPANEAATRYRGLFTDCLLKALKDRPIKVMVKRTEPPPECWVISPWGIKLYLKDAVPEAAERVSIQLVQKPEMRVESHLPTCLVEAPDYRPRKTKKPRQPLGPPEPPPSVLTLLDDLPADPLQGMPDSIRRELPALARPEALEEVRRLLDAKGRDHFETGTGFTVVGTGIRRATLSGGADPACFEESGAFHIRVPWQDPGRRGGSILIQFAADTATILAIAPGSIGTILVEDGRVVNVSYTPSPQSPEYAELRGCMEEIRKAHAYVAAAARNGVFYPDASQASMVAGIIRRYKRVDPTLGLYAAYAYAQVGALVGVRSVFYYMKEARGPVPFDIALLAGRLPDDGSLVGMADFAPACPMLTQGWALLEPHEKRLAPPLWEARAHLLPSLWTTFDATAAEVLWDAFKKGELA